MEAEPLRESVAEPLRESSAESLRESMAEPLRQSEAKRLARRGRTDELRRLAEAGDPQAARFFTRWLAQAGRVDELRRLVGHGDRAARWALADWLVRRRRVTEAVDVMRPLAAAGVPGAQRRFARLLGGLGRHVEAMAELAASPPSHGDLDRVRGWLDARGLVDRSGRPFRRYLESRPSRPELLWVVLLLWGREPRAAADLLRRVGPEEWVRRRLLAGLGLPWRRAEAIDLLTEVDPAVRRELVLLQGPHRQPAHHEFRVDGAYLTGVTFGPDGAILAASEGNAGTVRLRDVATGEPSHVLRTAGSWTCGAAFSPDGTVVACAGRTVRLWDPRTGALLRDLDGGPSPAVAFSPDGTLLAGDGLWRVDTGERLRDLPRAVAVAFSPDGRRIAAAVETPDHRPRIQVLDVATGRRILDLHSGHELDVVGGVAFSRDGTLAAIGTARWVRLFGLPDGTHRRDIHGAGPLVAFHPSGQLLATGRGGSGVEVWEVATGRRTRTVDTPATGFAFSPDGALLATVDAADAVVGLWPI